MLDTIRLAVRMAISKTQMQREIEQWEEKEPKLQAARRDKSMYDYCAFDNEYDRFYIRRSLGSIAMPDIALGRALPGVQIRRTSMLILVGS